MLHLQGLGGCGSHCAGDARVHATAREQHREKWSTGGRGCPQSVDPQVLQERGLLLLHPTAQLLVMAGNASVADSPTFPFLHALKSPPAVSRDNHVPIPRFHRDPCRSPRDKGPPTEREQSPTITRWPRRWYRCSLAVAQLFQRSCRPQLFSSLSEAKIRRVAYSVSLESSELTATVVDCFRSFESSIDWQTRLTRIRHNS